jgi:hypothetical protein
MRTKRLLTTVILASAALTTSCDTVFTDVYDEVSRPKLYVFGSFTAMGSVNRAGFAELDLASGKPTDNDSTFVANYLPVIRDSVVYHIVGAAGLSASSLETGALLWTVATDGSISMIAANEDYIFIGGSYSNLEGQAMNDLTRVRRDTGAVLPQPIVINGYVSAMALAGNTLYIAGSFTLLDSTEARNQIAAIDARTGALKSWYPTNGVDSPPDRMWISGNTLYVSGGFSQIGGKTRNRMAAVDCVTAEVLSFNPNIAGGNVTDCAFTDDTIYIAGNFTTVGSSLRGGIAAVNRTSGALHAWYPAINSNNAIVADEGKVYVGGGFTAINGVSRNYLAAFDGVSGNLLSWNPNAQANVSYMILLK